MTDPSHYSGKLPEYVCHKTVRAAKIAHIRHIAKGAELDLTGPKGEDLGVFVVGLDFDLFTTMKPGWYLMRFDDGTVTAQGAKAFEKGYTLKDVAEKKTAEKVITCAFLKHLTNR